MSKSIAYKHYSRIFAHWPKDPLRPECQFQDIMQRRMDKQFLPKPTSDSSAGAAAVASKPVNERLEMEQANILYSLLENRYIRRYPINGTLMTPASKPTYYKDLLAELEEAPNRTWWGQFKNKYKGMLRLQ